MSTRLIVPTSIDYSRKCPQMPQHRIKSARRVLFGIPNPEETKKFLDAAREMQQTNFVEKYSFDVINEVPIVGPAAKYAYVEYKIVEAPRKKRPIADVEESDENYFKPEEFIINRLTQDGIEAITKQEPQCRETRKKKQRCITDFMATKRNITATGKSEPANIQPTKITKLDLNG